jgi:hypothetical protein
VCIGVSKFKQWFFMNSITYILAMGLWVYTHQNPPKNSSKNPPKNTKKPTKNLRTARSWRGRVPPLSCSPSSYMLLCSYICLYAYMLIWIALYRLYAPRPSYICLYAPIYAYMPICLYAPIYVYMPICLRLMTRSLRGKVPPPPCSCNRGIKDTCCM